MSNKNSEVKLNLGNLESEEEEEEDEEEEEESEEESQVQGESKIKNKKSSRSNSKSKKSTIDVNKNKEIENNTAIKETEENEDTKLDEKKVNKNVNEDEDDNYKKVKIKFSETNVRDNNKYLRNRKFESSSSNRNYSHKNKISTEFTKNLTLQNSEHSYRNKSIFSKVTEKLLNSSSKKISKREEVVSSKSICLEIFLNDKSLAREYNKIAGSEKNFKDFEIRNKEFLVNKGKNLEKLKEESDFKFKSDTKLFSTFEGKKENKRKLNELLEDLEKKQKEIVNKKKILSDKNEEKIKSITSYKLIMDKNSAKIVKQIEENRKNNINFKSPSKLTDTRIIKEVKSEFSSNIKPFNRIHSPILNDKRYNRNKENFYFPLNSRPNSHGKTNKSLKKGEKEINDISIRLFTTSIHSPYKTTKSSNISQSLPKNNDSLNSDLITLNILIDDFTKAMIEHIINKNSKIIQFKDTSNNEFPENFFIIEKEEIYNLLLSLGFISKYEADKSNKFYDYINEVTNLFNNLMNKYYTCNNQEIKNDCNNNQDPNKEDINDSDITSKKDNENSKIESNDQRDMKDISMYFSFIYTTFYLLSILMNYNKSKEILLDNMSKILDNIQKDQTNLFMKRISTLRYSYKEIFNSLVLNKVISDILLSFSSFKYSRIDFIFDLKKEKKIKKIQKEMDFKINNPPPSFPKVAVIELEVDKSNGEQLTNVLKRNHQKQINRKQKILEEIVKSRDNDYKAKCTFKPNIERNKDTLKQLNLEDKWTVEKLFKENKEKNQRLEKLKNEINKGKEEQIKSECTFAPTFQKNNIAYLYKEDKIFEDKLFREVIKRNEKARIKRKIKEIQLERGLTSIVKIKDLENELKDKQIKSMNFKREHSKKKGFKNTFDVYYNYDNNMNKKLEGNNMNMTNTVKSIQVVKKENDQVIKKISEKENKISDSLNNSKSKIVDKSDKSETENSNKNAKVDIDENEIKYSERIEYNVTSENEYLENNNPESNNIDNIDNVDNVDNIENVILNQTNNAINNTIEKTYTIDEEPCNIKSNDLIIDNSKNMNIDTNIINQDSQNNINTNQINEEVEDNSIFDALEKKMQQDANIEKSEIVETEITENFPENS